jgi:UDP-glucose:(heptosyl)LPS alpha-1,3-glucosyltransferase
VQAARAIGSGHGVSGPSSQLERAFLRLGCTCERFTLDTLGLPAAHSQASAAIPDLVRFWRDIVVFSTAGSLAMAWRFRRRRRRAGTVVICQVDALYGDLFVVRSLHKAFLERHPSRRLMLLRNPLHALVLLRDHARFRWGIHRHIVALSEANRQEVIRLYGVPADRITVIPNGVDLDRFRPSHADRRDVRRAVSIADDEFVVMFAGHAFERKGLRVLLDAQRALAARGVRVSMIVAGGDSSDVLKREYRDLEGTLRFLGHRDDIERYYAAADVFAMPASFDISPLVGLEALASGLPILMTDVGGVGEYLRHGENGWFITRDPEDVARRLATLAQDPVTLAQATRAARASVADRGWESIAARYLALMERLFPEGSGGAASDGDDRSGGGASLGSSRELDGPEAIETGRARR